MLKDKRPPPPHGRSSKKVEVSMLGDLLFCHSGRCTVKTYSYRWLIAIYLPWSKITYKKVNQFHSKPYISGLIIIPGLISQSASQYEQLKYFQVYMPD